MIVLKIGLGTTLIIANLLLLLSVESVRRTKTDVANKIGFTGMEIVYLLDMIAIAGGLFNA